MRPNTAFEKGTIAAHRRSGSHLFLQFLRNYRSAYNIHDFRIRHLEFDNAYAPFVYPKDTSEVVHIVRDPRDVIVSCWHYYPQIKRFAGSGIDWKQPSDFVRGAVFDGQEKKFEGSCDWSYEQTAKESDMQNWCLQMFYDPIGYWVRFVSGWLGRAILVKFEQMVSVRHNNSDEGRMPLVGPFKRKGVSGDWKNYFSPEDNKLFWSKAEEIMNYLGYEKE